MAGIDKTYTNSWEEYNSFKEWAVKQYVTFFNGHKVCIGNFIYNWDKEDFGGKELPVMNTPSWVDVFLIQNCKQDFVLNRMKQVYNSDFDKMKLVDLTSPPTSNYQKNRKIIICRTKETIFPIHRKPYDGKTKWWLQCYDGFVYCDKSKVWSSDQTYYPYNTNTAHIKSIKGVVRHLRKQYLPSGVTFMLIGRYIGEEYLIKIK